MPAAEFLTLDDGREFAYYEYGDPTGVPAVYITGTPASGLAGALYDDAARAHGVRVISVDKPGYGRSSFDPVRSLSRHAADVTALADHLGLDRFAVIGESGGGPHALAVGRYLPERLTVAIVLAGLGPATERWVVEGMRKENRRLLTLAQRAPWVLSIPIAMMARQMSTPARVAKAAARQQRKSPEADRRFWQEHPERAAFMYAATADAFRQGSRATTQELVLLARPWGFGLDEVKAPTHVWHGTEDVNVPIAIASRICEQLPDCTAHIMPGKGHAVSMYDTDAIMATVTSAAKS